MIQECFTWAIHREAHYFWAGTMPYERTRIREKYDITLTELPIPNA